MPRRSRLARALILTALAPAAGCSTAKDLPPPAAHALASVVLPGRPSCFHPDDYPAAGAPNHLLLPSPPPRGGDDAPTPTLKSYEIDLLISHAADAAATQPDKPPAEAGAGTLRTLSAVAAEGRPVPLSVTDEITYLAHAIRSDKGTTLVSDVLETGLSAVLTATDGAFGPDLAYAISISHLVRMEVGDNGVGRPCMAGGHAEGSLSFGDGEAVIPVRVGPTTEIVRVRIRERSTLLPAEAKPSAREHSPSPQPTAFPTEVGTTNTHPAPSPSDAAVAGPVN